MSKSIPRTKREWVGRYVRLREHIETETAVFEAGEVMRITRRRAGLHLESLGRCQSCERKVKHGVAHVHEDSVILLPIGWKPKEYDHGLRSIPRLITVDELASIMRLDRKTVYAAIHEGTVPGVRYMGPKSNRTSVIRINWDVVSKWLEGES
jgi:excisionase family DNA binding protein